jgi:hypothetical protein
MPNKRRSKRRGKGPDPAKRHFVDSNTSVGSANRVRVADDLTRHSLVPSLSGMRMPKNMQTQIHWFQSTVSQTANLSGSGITEANRSFLLNDVAYQSQLAQIFDQYAIFAVYIRVVVSGSFSNAARVVTAIDYDNTANIGNINTLMGYSTAAVATALEVQERYIEPCNAPALYNGSAFSAYGQDRMWIDTANTAVPHYGFRCIVDAATSGVINQTFTYVICARNVI